MLNLLEISLASGVSASLRNISEKHNIIIHLWTNCFYCLLENLWCSFLSSKIALEYLQEFIYYAYTFYTSHFKRNRLSCRLAGGPVGALDDLMQSHIIIVMMVSSAPHTSSFSLGDYHHVQCILFPPHHQDPAVRSISRIPILLLSTIIIVGPSCGRHLYSRLSLIEIEFFVANLIGWLIATDCNQLTTGQESNWLQPIR